jgi:thioredoxin 1
MASPNVTELTGADFDSTIKNSTVPVVVDCWAPWCGPCLAFTPVLEQFAAEQGEKVKVTKLNIDTEENQAIGARFNIRAIPTLLWFKDGELKATTNQMSKDGLAQKLQSL